MERDQLSKLFREYWRFAREFVSQRGDFEKTLANAEVCEPGAEFKICQGFHEHGIDPMPFWEFHNLIWRELIPHTEAGELPADELRELRRYMHRAWLCWSLFDKSAVAEMDPIEEDIIEVIKAAGRRLTTGEILSGLEKMNREKDATRFIHGDSTVKKWLAIMVANNRLYNKKDNKGYGIAGTR